MRLWDNVAKTKSRESYNAVIKHGYEVKGQIPINGEMFLSQHKEVAAKKQSKYQRPGNPSEQGSPAI